MLRWAILGCLVLGLAGCGFGKKDKTNASKPGAGSAPPSPTYPWQPPDNVQQPPRPSTKSEKTDPF